MKLGISGLLPTDPQEIDEAAVARIREAGFTGTTLFLMKDHGLIDDAQCGRIARAFEAADVDVVQLGAWMCPLLDRDSERLAESRRQRREALRIASAIGAGAIALGPGTLSRTGGSGFDMIEQAWYPSAENAGQEAFDAIVTELRRDAELACALGVHIALECHVFTPLNTPRRVRQIVDAVGSPWVGVTADPANWITPVSYFDTTTFLHEMFDALGDTVRDAHVKDIVFEDSMQMHSNDAVPGDGAIDFVTFMSRMAAANPNAYALIEHIAPEDVPRARAYVVAAAAKAGVVFDADGRRAGSKPLLSL